MIAIERMGNRGEGIARAEGKPVYIPYTLPGEAVMACVSGERGELTEIATPSPDRIAPFCPHFGVCGGCLLQHWAPSAYREWKRGLVAEALRQRHIEADVAPLIDAHGEGRRRVILHIRGQGGRVTAGFMRLRSHDLHDIDRCPIVVPNLAGVPDIARRIGGVTGDCDAAFTATLGGIDVALKGVRGLKETQRLALAALARDLRLARLSLHHELIVELASPDIAIGRARVKPPSISFLQATALGEAKLAECVQTAVGRAKRIADLFCGIGPFALRLAEKARVTAVDSDEAAIASLATAVRGTQGLKPITAETRDLFTNPLTPAELAEFDAVVLDPPRAGAEAQARSLARSKTKLVVSVSCDAGSFARDAAILIAGGYRLGSVTPIDQFAWSPHVEIVGTFSR